MSDTVYVLWVLGWIYQTSTSYLEVADTVIKMELKDWKIVKYNYDEVVDAGS